MTSPPEGTSFPTTPPADDNGDRPPERLTDEARLSYDRLIDLRVTELERNMVSRFGDFRWDIAKQAMYAAFAILAVLFVAMVGLLRVVLPTDPKSPSQFIDQFGILIIAIAATGAVIAVAVIARKAIKRTQNDVVSLGPPTQ